MEDLLVISIGTALGDGDSTCESEVIPLVMARYPIDR